MAYPKGLSNNTVLMTAKIADISTAGQVYVAPGFDGKIKQGYSSLGGAITGADADLTLKVSGTAVTNGVITVAQSGSAAGDVDSCTPSANNTFTSTDHIEIETDGASTGTQEVVYTLVLESI